MESSDTTLIRKTTSVCTIQADHIAKFSCRALHPESCSSYLPYRNNPGCPSALGCANADVDCDAGALRAPGRLEISIH